MSTLSLGTPLTREDSKKLTCKIFERTKSCVTHDDCKPTPPEEGDGLCINGICQCMLECSYQTFIEPYDKYCKVDGIMSYDRDTFFHTVEC